jgi:hypothetical protein
MSLQELFIDVSSVSPTADAAEFIAEADVRIDAYLDQDRKLRLARYIPSDPLAVYAALAVIIRDDLAPGNNFCEWGSGFGVATCLATMLGYDAVGIEMDPVLHRESIKLAKDFEIRCEFSCGDFVPSGFEFRSDDKRTAGGLVESSLLPSQEQFRDSFFDDAYPIDDFDVIYSYPWPGEAAMLEDLFDSAAAEDTLLVTYCSVDGIRVFMKE